MDRSTVARYEAGGTQIDADFLPTLAAALGIRPCDFFRESSPTERRVAELRESYLTQWARDGVQEDLVGSGLRALERLTEEDRRAIIAFARFLERRGSAGPNRPE